MGDYKQDLLMQDQAQLVHIMQLSIQELMMLYSVPIYNLTQWLHVGIKEGRERVEP